MIRTQDNIPLKDDFSAELTLQALSLQSTTFIIKIKSNINEGIQVKPSHFAMHSDSNSPSSRTLLLQYKGKKQQVDKAKLKINWLTIKNHQGNNYVDLKSNEISQLYKQYLNNRQKQSSLILTFTYQGKQQIQQLRFVKEQPLIAQQEQPMPRIITQQKQKQIIIQQEPLPPSRQPKIEIFSNLTQFLVFILISFLLGVSFGIKWQQLSKELPFDLFALE